MVYTTGDNNYATARFIVGPLGKANYTTIASALTAASSGDTIFLLPGTYTENLTLKAGVNLSAYICDAQTPNVTIIGKCTATFAGTCSISGIRLQTNSNFFLEVSGSSATIVYLNECVLNCVNFTGMLFSSSSASSRINIKDSYGFIGTSLISLFTSSSAGQLNFQNVSIENSSSSTPSDLSAGVANFYYCAMSIPLSTTSTGSIGAYACIFSTSNTNATTILLDGTGTASFSYTSFSSGNASCISAGIGNSVSLSECILNSLNTNAITGLGSVSYGNVDFTNSSKSINATTQSFFNSGTWTPALAFGGSSSGIVYSQQDGVWSRYGNVIYFTFNIVITNNGTGSGVATVTLPFTPASSPQFIDQWMSTPVGLSPPANYCESFLGITGGSASANLNYVITSGGAGNFTDSHITGSSIIRCTGFYYI